MTTEDPRHYDVILSPVITEKATLASERNQVVFKVALAASKPEVSRPPTGSKRERRKSRDLAAARNERDGSLETRDPNDSTFTTPDRREHRISDSSVRFSSFSPKTNLVDLAPLTSSRTCFS